MQALTNILRVVLVWLWTVIIGIPLIVAISLRYWYAQAWAWAGRADILDHTLEANAYFAGWVAQKLWTGVLLPILGVRLHTNGFDRVDWSKSHVLCANHASIIDVLALVRSVPPPFRFVAKHELVSWPIIGWALRPAGQIVVDRADHAKSVESIAQAAARRIRGQVIFFVEGTRSRTGELQPFKKGAFHFAINNSLPILPTAIRGSYRTLARLPWWKLRPGQEIEVAFCPPIQPRTGPGNHVGLDTLRDETRRVIAGALESRGREA
jgi:1-acyl-sn-glycerol-3-phosphate acyltransferase